MAGEGGKEVSEINKDTRMMDVKAGEHCEQYKKNPLSGYCDQSVGGWCGWCRLLTPEWIKYLERTLTNAGEWQND